MMGSRRFALISNLNLSAASAETLRPVPAIPTQDRLSTAAPSNKFGPVRNKETETALMPKQRRNKMATTVENRRETGNLIGSDKVEGTGVHGVDESKIGNVQRVMIDKIAGQVRYVVVSFGGFLGIGEDYYPMPWQKLKYDTRLGGYRVDMTEAQRKGAPKFNRNTDWDWSNQARERTLNDYYNIPL
jgi:hypothetical protein